MATIHDVMPAFELFQPASVDDALSLLERHRKSVWVLAGGLDTFDWLKDRNKRPQVVIDLSGIKELSGIKASADGGLEIGATTTLTEIANHPEVKAKFGLLAVSAGLVASPQIRNQRCSMRTAALR
jgi:xanthine dehydrogenase YagS FAD-binding subunit